MTSVQKAAWCAGTFLVTAMVVLPPLVRSDTVGGLNTFTAGEIAKASEVNQNFSAVESAVDGNDGLIAALEARVDAVEATDPVPGPQGEQGLQGVPGPAGEDAARFELVGFSTATFNGAEGVLGYTLACQEDFPNSRMCTSVEVMNTENVPTGLAGASWLRPVLVPSSTGSGFSLGVDASGVTSQLNNSSGSPGQLSCAGWTGANTGLTVDSLGRFSRESCSTILQIACCSQAP